MKVKQKMVQNMVYLSDVQEDLADTILRWMDDNDIPYIQNTPTRSSAVNFAIRRWSSAIRAGRYVDTATLARMAGDYAVMLMAPQRHHYSVWYSEDVQEDISTIGLHLELREDFRIRWLKRTKTRSYNRNMVAVFAMDWLVQQIRAGTA